MLGDGAPLGVIGVQCHMGEPLTSPQDVVRILDRFAKFGLPIQATEFDINVEDEEMQGDYMRDFLTAFFSHPATEAIPQWGFWEGQHWVPRAALFRKDWSMKPNGRAFADLVRKEWWTDVSGTTGPDGRYQTRGFLGDYEVEVKAGGSTMLLPAKIARGGALANYAGFSIYGATKAALESVSEALALETKSAGIKITLIEPRPFRTNFIAQSLEKPPVRIEDYASSVGKFTSLLERMNGRQPSDPVKAAEAIIALTKLSQPPLRLALGKYASEKAQRTLNARLSEAQTWEHLGLPTDF